MSNVWHVQDLFEMNFSDRSIPTVEDGKRMVDELKSEFITTNDSVPMPSEMVTWAASKFFIDLDTFTFDDLEKNYSKRMKQLVGLNKILNEIDELRMDEQIKDDILRIANCMRGSYDCLRESALLYHRMDPMRELRLPKDSEIQSILQYNDEKLTSFQKLLLFFAKILDVNEFRKMNDQCWKQIHNSQGIPTQSWKYEITIEEMLYKSVKKEKCFKEWTYLTNPKDNAKHIIDHLIASDQSEFPTLTVDRHKWSYDDGIYDTETDTFWPFEDQDEWDTLGNSIQEYRRQNGWGDDYTVVPPSGENMTVKYFNQPFRFRITPETEATFDPHSIILPELDIIFEAQHLTRDTIDWCLIMLARLFFKVGEKDKWQVVFFIKGVAASGKSTLAKLIRYMYPPNLITTLSSNVEAKFGLSAIYKGLICVCAEVREDFGLNQADWQSAASGEEISIAIKNKTAIQHSWDTPFFFLGNELPDYKNAAGSVDRRIFIIEFNYKIRGGGDPNLFDKMVNNIDLFHRKSVRLYLDTVRKDGDKDIWCPKPALLSQQIYDFKYNMRAGVDCLFNFLNAGNFEFDPQYDMPLKDFKELYSLFRKSNGEEKCKWNKDHYHATFQERGIKISKKTKDINGKSFTGEFVIGLQAKRDEQDDDK